MYVQLREKLPWKMKGQNFLSFAVVGLEVSIPNNFYLRLRRRIGLENYWKKDSESQCDKIV